MNRSLIYIAILLLALAVGFGISKYSGKAPPNTATPASGQGQAANVSSKTIEEKAATYSIDVKYPEFGVAPIDVQIASEAHSIVSQFKSDSESEGLPQGAPAYELNLTYDHTYIGTDFVSTRLYVTGYMGGAHPNTTIEGLNYDRITGKKLTLDDALKLIGLTLADVVTSTKQQLTAKLGADMFFSEGADAKPDNYGAFSIDADSVTFIFQPYQFAAYASGPQEVSFKRK